MSEPIKDLWCVNIIGPDDVHAAPDFDTAEAWAIQHNRLMREYTVARGMETDPYWPEVRAVVAIWPWTPEDHARDLPKSIQEFTPRASAMSAGTAETPQEAQGEARQRDGEAETPDPSPDTQSMGDRE